MVAVDAEEHSTTDLPVVDVDCDPGHSSVVNDLPLPAGVTDNCSSSVATNCVTTPPPNWATTTAPPRRAPLLRCADPRRPLSPTIELTSWRLNAFDPGTRLSASAVPLHRTSRSDDVLAATSLGALGGESTFSKSALQIVQQL